MISGLNGYVKALTDSKVEDDKTGTSDTWADAATAEHAPSGGNGRFYWAPNQIRILVTIQLAVGILCIVFQIIAVVFHSALTNSGHGIWAGILFIAAGSIGFVSSNQKTQISILVHLVSCILAAAASFCVIILSSGGLVYDRKLHSIESLDMYHYSSKGSRVAADAILVTLATVELIVAIWCIVLCSRVIFYRYKRGGIFVPFHVQYTAPDLQTVSQNSRIVSQSTVYPVSSIVPLLCEEDDSRLQNTG